MVPSMGKSIGCCIRGSACVICMGAGVGYSVCFSLKDCFPSFTSKSWLVDGRPTIVLCLLV